MLGRFRYRSAVPLPNKFRYTQLVGVPVIAPFPCILKRRLYVRFLACYTQNSSAQSKGKSYMVRRNKRRPYRLLAQPQQGPLAAARQKRRARGCYQHHTVVIGFTRHAHTLGEAMSL